MKTQGKIEIQQVAMAPPGAAKMLNLKWDNRDRIVNTKSFEFYLGNDFTDCLLSAEGNYLACHQIVLATSSPYFDNIFRSKLCGPNPVLIFNDLKFDDIIAAMTYVYTGEVKVSENRIVSLTNAMVAMQIPNAKEFYDYSKAHFREGIKSEVMSVNGDHSPNESSIQATDFLEIKHDVETPNGDNDMVMLADFVLGNNSLPNQSFAPRVTPTPVIAETEKSLEEANAPESAPAIAETKKGEVKLHKKTAPELPDATGPLEAVKLNNETGSDLDQTFTTAMGHDSHHESKQNGPIVTDALVNIEDDEDSSCQINQVDPRAKEIKKEKLKVTRPRRKSRAKSSSKQSPTDASPKTNKRKKKHQKANDESLEAENSEVEELCTAPEQVKKSPKIKKRKITAETTGPEMELDNTEATMEEQLEPAAEPKSDDEEKHEDSTAQPEVKVRRCKYCGIAIDGSPSTVKQEKKKHQKVCPENPRLQLTKCPFCQLQLTEKELNSHVQAEHGMYA